METTATATEIRTEKIMFNGREVELNYEGEELISVTADGKEIWVCKKRIQNVMQI
jgi:hypothetical protein